MTHVAFLRAVNVGGKAVVKMADVRKAFAAAGCQDVTTLGHAGNVLFSPGARSAASQQKKILAAMHALLGAKPSICFRELDQLVALVEANPFRDQLADPSAKLYVTFMDRQPETRPRFPIRIPKEGLEVTGMRGAEMFIVSRRKANGMYGFPNAVVERFGVVATTRNWNTVYKLAQLAGEANTSRRP